MPFSHYYGLWKNIPHCLTQIQMGLAGRLLRKRAGKYIGQYPGENRSSGNGSRRALREIQLIGDVPICSSIPA